MSRFDDRAHRRLLRWLCALVLVVLGVGLWARVAHAAPAPGTAPFGWYNPNDGTAGVFSTGAEICLYYQQKNNPNTSFPFMFVDHGNDTGECDQKIGTVTEKEVSVSFKGPSCPSGTAGQFSFVAGWESAAQKQTGEWTGPHINPTDGQTYSDGACALLYTGTGDIQCFDANAPGADGLYAVTCTYTGTYTGDALVASSGSQGAVDPGCPGAIDSSSGTPVCDTGASGGGSGTGGNGTGSGGPASGATVSVKGPSTGSPTGGDADILGDDPQTAQPDLGPALGASDALAPLLGVIPRPGDISVQLQTTECPAPTFQVFGQTYQLIEQCVLLAQYAQLIKTATIAAWSLAGLLIVLRA